MSEAPGEDVENEDVENEAAESGGTGGTGESAEAGGTGGNGETGGDVEVGGTDGDIRTGRTGETGVTGRTGENDGDVETGDTDAPDERDDLSGQRMVNIEPGPGEGDGDDELALRRLFQGAVSGLEPTPGSLEHLRRAVPARRARKRQAIVGAAAAAVLIGTAVPAFVHVAASGGISAAGNPVNAGHGEEAQGGTGTETGVEGGQSSRGPASSVSPSQGAADGSSGKPQRPGPGVSGTGPRQTQGAGSGSLRCGAEQLGVSGAGAGGPDGEGKVYGTFRITNISGQDCVVDGSGVVSFEARGAADPARISVIRHTSGDGGGGLPDPSQESSSLVLGPSGSYEVKFVWVPSETCPTTGTSPTPTTPPPTEQPTTPPPTENPTGGNTGNPEPTEGAGSGGGGTEPGTGAEAGAGADAGTGAAPQLLREDGGLADGSVLVSHVAEPGGPAASAIVPNACAGTIYRTGILAGS
ncbi:hypothetical protein ACFV14_11390 [Streptomyces zaomyceticus]|uniref:hypothetical protein n=1 Tax=Streptomyces zaomyceticus TaxID=68286 RepID=UPI0036CF2164